MAECEMSSPELSEECIDGKLVQTLAQFGDSIVDFSSQYGSDMSMSYSAINLAGKPNIYPSYGDFTMAFVMLPVDQTQVVKCSLLGKCPLVAFGSDCTIVDMRILVLPVDEQLVERTYGNWWNTSPCAPPPFKEKRHHPSSSQDFVEIKFEKCVYPTKINIFETYNPGAVVRIFACNAAKLIWVNLWQGQAEPTKLEEARVFSPPLRRVNFLTNLIRIEFCHRYLHYYAAIDSVSLIGIPEAVGTPFVAVTAASLVTYVYPTDQTGLNVVCNQLEGIAISLPPSLKLPLRPRAYSQSDHRDRTNYFELLPSEVIHLIISHLDLKSLCNTACTCRLLQRQCYDPLLYTELDLQPYWNIANDNNLVGLESRCKNIRRLNLSWCGDLGAMSTAAVIKFLKACGRRLTCVRLSNCQIVTNEVLKILADVAVDLEELDLQSCQQDPIDSVGFQEISRFRQLKWLNLYRTLIDSQSIFTILRNCRSLEFLGLGSCNAITSYDEVAQIIGQFCRDLRGLDLWRAKTFTAVGVKIIANNCRKLEEIDMGWCSDVCSNNGCIVELAQKCCHLKKLVLTALRTICDTDISALANCCPDLEQLDILGTREVSAYSCSRLLMYCPRLKYIDVSFCGQIDMGTVLQWQRAFPQIHFKRSNQKFSGRHINCI